MNATGQVTFTPNLTLPNSTDQVLQALAKVKSKLQGVAKSTNNPFFKSKYADLNAYLDAVEPLLEENGMLLLQPVTAVHTNQGLENVVTSRIVHVASGQTVESSMKLVGGSDMQKMGSGVTYARRYTLGSLLSMQALDDDGEAFIDRGSKDKQPAKAQPAPAKAVTVEEQKPSSLPKSTLVPSQAQETKSARPSFKRPAKPAVTETTPVEDTGHGDDI